MRTFLILSLSLLAQTAFAAKLHTPKLPYTYEVCEARHAGKCWTKEDKAPVSCDSDLDQVCRTLDASSTGAVPESLACKKLDLSLGSKISENFSTAAASAFDFFIYAIDCDFGKECQMQLGEMPGKTVPYYLVTIEGKKELRTENIMTPFVRKTYGFSKEEAEVKTKIITSLKCK